MREAAARKADLWHAAFLRRLVGAPSADAVEGRLGQGGFLVLRLVDLLESEQPVHADAFHYQQAAAERFCQELPVDRTETAHLVDLTRSAAGAWQELDVRLVLPALLAYAHHLEDELRLDESLDVLETAVRVGGEALRPADAIAVRLRKARVLRKLNRFDEAQDFYVEAGTLATVNGDRRSALLSRIGHADATRGRGNLVEAERALRHVLADSESAGDQDAAARAHQVIAVVLSTGGRPADAVVHAWQAFQLYDDEPARLRVLNDLGVMLLSLGRPDVAELALREVVRRGGCDDNTSNALVELMHCASYRRDRVGFERYREQCEARSKTMPPNILADFHLKSGIGRARFGQFERADALLATALRVAEEGGLHELVFRIERIKSGLRDCQEALEPTPGSAAEPAAQIEAIDEVSASLTQLQA
jgi:tetratricopeptide (TPR) repeat protein